MSGEKKASGREVKDTENVKKWADMTHEEKKAAVIREIISWLFTIAAAVVIAIIVTRVVIIKTEVISGSMIHTIEVDDKIVGNRIAYLFSDPKRGEIIFFKYPDNEEEVFVKRIIGLPGETVTIVDGLVYINDSDTPLDEPYLNGKMKGSFGPYVVPEGEYFVLGDNRNNSVDSRYWNDKYVAYDQILAKAVLRWAPFDRFGVMHAAEYAE